MNDWADDVAAQIMVIAFTKKNASEIIAEITRLAYARGELAGIEKSSETVNRILSNYDGGKA